MLRRTLVLAALALPLAGCVTYEVVERRVYHEDGRITRDYDPYKDGRRYDGRYVDDGYRYGDGRGGFGDGRSPRVIIIDRPAPVIYGGWGAPVQRWPGGTWIGDRPYHGRGHGWQGGVGGARPHPPRPDRPHDPRPDPRQGGPRPIAPEPAPGPVPMPMPTPMPMPEPPDTPPPPPMAPEVRVPEPEVPQGPRVLPTHIE